MERSHKKLGLNRETLRRLANPELEGVAGGLYPSLVCGTTGLCTTFGGCTVPQVSGACSDDCPSGFIC